MAATLAESRGRLPVRIRLIPGNCVMQMTTVHVAGRIVMMRAAVGCLRVARTRGVADTAEERGCRQEER